MGEDARPRRPLRIPTLVALTLTLTGSAAAADWPEFGYIPSRQNVGPANAGITAANVAKLHRRTIQLDGTVDSSPIYVGGVIYVTTTYGRTEAIDAKTGKVRWRFIPPTYGSYVGSAQITNMTPIADPDHTAIYAGAPDGVIRKLAIATGKQLWATKITRDPTHEKLTSSLNLSRGLVIATTGGYIGDAPPYQGHVVTLNAKSGHIAHVWNSLCADRHALIQPSTCDASDSAIWARSGAVVDPATGNLLVATGNAPYDGKTNFGDSVIVLSSNAARMLGHWAPDNTDELDSADLDLGSTAPALLSGGYFVQGGKDGKLRLITMHSLKNVQTVSTPGSTDLFSAPAVWQGTWVFVADSAGTDAWRLSGGSLHQAWSNGTGGNSPVLAGGLLYVQGSGGIHVYNPASGHEITVLPCGDAHWQSPIVVDGRVIAVEGDANQHSTSGTLDIYS
jgi:outer membrane protein assembly factor BamB